MVQTWFRHGSDMVLTWFRHGSDIVQTWFKHGSDMVQTWFRHGSDMVLTWFRHGSDMVQTWFRHGSHMVQTVNVRDCRHLYHYKTFKMQSLILKCVILLMCGCAQMAGLQSERSSRWVHSKNESNLFILLFTSHVHYIVGTFS